jgi:hypothetical protein
MTDKPPYTCNVKNVAFLEAVHPTDTLNEFRVYFGGSDAVIGSAIVQIRRQRVRSVTPGRGCKQGMGMDAADPDPGGRTRTYVGGAHT